VLLGDEQSTGQYLASLEVFHQLHCLDLLRKVTFREYYYEEGSFTDDHQKHLEHCIEELRQSLMCHGDMSLLTYNWVEGESLPHANFNTIHTCKNWDKIMDWVMDRDVRLEWEDGKMIANPLKLKPKNGKGMAVPP
jgi:hypothetical protein